MSLPLPIPCPCLARFPHLLSLSVHALTRSSIVPVRYLESESHTLYTRTPYSRAPYSFSRSLSAKAATIFESVSPSRRNSSSGFASWPDVSRVRSGVSTAWSGVSTARLDVSRARPMTVSVSQSRFDRRTRDCSVLSPFATMTLPFLPKRF